MAFGEPYDLSQELLIDLTQNFSWEELEGVRAVRIVKAIYDFFEDLIIDF
jgi:hypothetical protein